MEATVEAAVEAAGGGGCCSELLVCLNCATWFEKSCKCEKSTAKRVAVASWFKLLLLERFTDTAMSCSYHGWRRLPRWFVLGGLLPRLCC